MTVLMINRGTHRVFIGIPVSEKVQSGINELLSQFEIRQQGIRWVPENNRHLTVAFLGDIQASVVEHLLYLTEECYRYESGFRYRLSALSRFPDPAGSIIALTGEPVRSLVNLHQKTLNILLRCMIQFDRKEFRPHITLGRIRRTVQLKETLDLPVDIEMHITRIVVYQSRLTDMGSVYLPLKEIQLN